MSVDGHVNNCCLVWMEAMRVSDASKDVKMELVVVVFSTETQWAHQNASPCNFETLKSDAFPHDTFSTP